MSAGQVCRPACAVGAAGAAAGLAGAVCAQVCCSYPCISCTTAVCSVLCLDKEEQNSQMQALGNFPFFEMLIVSVLELKPFAVFLNSVTPVNNFVVASDVLAKINVP